MLPKQHRLTEKKDFKRAATKGRSFFVKEFGIKSIRRKQGSEPLRKDSEPGLPTRVGIVVPKKLTKTIVKRNRIKRQVRHIFLKLINNIVSGYDLVFLAREDFLNLKFEEMENKIITVLKRIRLIKN